MARLRKSEAEAIMAAIDSPDLVRVLLKALERVLDCTGSWSDLLLLASETGHWSAERTALLRAVDTDALVELALELNETRTVWSVS
jgi:hypothetical protein